MSIQENKALIRQVFDEAVNQGNLAVVDVLFSSDFVDHSTPNQVPGPEGVTSYFASIRASFPAMYVTIDDMIAEGDKVVVRTTWRGAIYEGITPTGKPVARTLIQIFRIEDGAIREEWNEGGSLL